VAVPAMGGKGDDLPQAEQQPPLCPAARASWNCRARINRST